MVAATVRGAECLEEKEAQRTGRMGRPGGRMAEGSRDRHGLFITGSHLQTPHSNQIACTGPRSTCISGDTLHQDMGPCELISVPC